MMGDNKSHNGITRNYIIEKMDLFLAWGIPSEEIRIIYN
jgi:hypothetical protein